MRNPSTFRPLKRALLGTGALLASSTLTASLALAIIPAPTAGAVTPAASALRAAASASPSASPVDVLYAASLQALMADHLGPAFQKATGDTFHGLPDGSSALAADIKGKLDPADVFISASPAVDKTLEGKANGNWISSYRTFAYSYLEIGYYPKSKFAAQLKSKPWYQVVGETGFKLGRTDPATDPKGVLAVQALDGAATKYHEPALKAIATEKDNVFPEAGLASQVQLGDLDAGFFYAVEAKAAKIPTVALTGFTGLKASYTVAIVNGGPHPAAAKAFVNYLLSAAGSKILEQQGLTTTK